MSDDFINVTDAVRIADAEGKPISRYTILKAIRTGKFSARKVGDRVLIFKRSAFLIWLHSPRRPGPKPGQKTR